MRVWAQIAHQNDAISLLLPLLHLKFDQSCDYNSVQLARLSQGYCAD